MDVQHWFRRALSRLHGRYLLLSVPILALLFLLMTIPYLEEVVSPFHIHPIDVGVSQRSFTDQDWNFDILPEPVDWVLLQEDLGKNLDLQSLANRFRQYESLVGLLEEQVAQFRGVIDIADDQLAGGDSTMATDSFFRRAVPLGTLAEQTLSLAKLEERGLQEEVQRLVDDPETSEEVRKAAMDTGDLIDLERQSANAYSLHLEEVQTFSAELEEKVRAVGYSTRIEATVPEKIYPGLPFRVHGKVIAEGPPSVGRLVTVRLGNILMGTAVTTAGEDFNIEVLASPVMPDGLYPLEIKVEASGVQRGTLYAKMMEMARFRPEVQLVVTERVVFPGDVLMRGAARSEFGPLEGATVVVRFSGQSKVTVIGPTGDFTMIFSPIYTNSWSGEAPVSVRVLPREPWVESIDVVRSVQRINFLAPSVLLVFLGLITLGVLWFRGRRSGLTIPSNADGPRTDMEGTDSMYTRSSRIDILLKWTSAQRHIWLAYQNVELVALRTSRILLSPAMTLREIREILQQRWERWDARFAELSHLVERALYGRGEPSPKDITLAQQLSESVIRENALKVETKQHADQQDGETNEPS